MLDERRRPRSRISGHLRIHWNDNVGNYFDLNGEWCDLSEIGGGLHLKRPIKPGTTVQVASPWLLKSGMAVVRNCGPLDCGFHLGLEFVSGTKGQQIEGHADDAGLPSRSEPSRGVGSGGQPPPRTCVLCGLNGHSHEAYIALTNGFEPGAQPPGPYHFEDSPTLQTQTSVGVLPSGGALPRIPRPPSSW